MAALRSAHERPPRPAGLLCKVARFITKQHTKINVDPDNFIILLKTTFSGADVRNNMKKTYQILAIFFVAIGFILMIVFSILIIKQEYLKNVGIDLDKVGAFGSFIGGLVGSLWSLAGIFLLFQALKDQNEINEISRKAYQTDIEELKLSRSSFQKQTINFEIQQFEQTFYNFLNRVFEYEDSIEFEKNNILYKGKKYFKFLIEEYKKYAIQYFYHYEIFDGDLELKISEKEIEKIKKNGREYYRNKKGQKLLTNYLSTDNHLDDEYFINLYRFEKKLYEDNSFDVLNFYRLIENLLEFIEDSKIQDKMKYSNIITSMLTKEEILMAYYTSQIPHKDFFSDYKTENNQWLLFCKYGLFNNLSASDMLSFNIYESILQPDGERTNSNYPIDNFGADFLSFTIENFIWKTIQDFDLKFNEGVGQYLRMEFETQKLRESNRSIALNSKIIFYKENFEADSSKLGQQILKWIVIDTFNHTYKRIRNDFNKEIEYTMSIEKNDAWKNHLIFKIEWEIDNTVSNIV